MATSTKKLRGLYGIKEADTISNNQLVWYMDKYSYYRIPFISKLLSHRTLHTKSFLWVDEFVVKDFHKDDAYHLLSYILKNDEVSMNWFVKNYLLLLNNFVLWKRECWHFYSWLSPQSSSSFPTSKTKTPTICTTPMDGTRLLPMTPNESRTRPHISAG